jgi:hypothetical protein
MMKNELAASRVARVAMHAHHWNSLYHPIWARSNMQSACHRPPALHSAALACCMSAAETRLHRYLVLGCQGIIIICRSGTAVQQKTWCNLNSSAAGFVLTAVVRTRVPRQLYYLELLQSLQHDK